MPRKLLIENSDYPFHVTNRSNNKEFFIIPLDELWDLFMVVLKKIKKEYKCELLQFVLMSNHYHLMLSTPQKNLSQCMLYLHREIAKQANKKTNRINHFFGGRYQWCMIHTELYYWNCVKYIFRNPVEAQLCQAVEDYKFSSINYHEELFFLSDFFYNKGKVLQPDIEWLNSSFDIQQKEAIRKALKQKIFKIPKGKNRQITVLENFKFIGKNDDAQPPLQVLGTY